jgi:hypothetical protein
MTLPTKIRLMVREQVWRLADEADWLTLPDAARTRKYEEWTRDPEIGGVLGRYVDAKQVRVYLKDSVIKPYTIARGSDPSRPFRVLGLAEGVSVAAGYTKPHGRCLGDGRVVCWGQARDWKGVLLAAWERAYEQRGARPYGVVLTSAGGQWASEGLRARGEELRRRLGVEHLVWLES